MWKRQRSSSRTRTPKTTIPTRMRDNSISTVPQVPENFKRTTIEPHTNSLLLATDTKNIMTVFDAVQDIFLAAAFKEFSI